ncbi:MAG: YgiQ family radical SAM protein, partial [Clostridiales bacterium]|nr:YgiQ family radical SAM protein [Clostridiales bacterium]
MTNSAFLPVSREDMLDRGWYYYDFLLVTGDAYVDHPSFGAAVIGRVLEADGYRVAVLAQPDWKSTRDFVSMGKPRYAALVGAGNLDSMVAHYTAAKKPRSEDFYSPGKKAGLRPDRAAIVYANRVREAFPELPVIIGGLEASLRRFAHYDYWEDKVRRPILFDAKADLLIYGMGENAVRDIAEKLKHGVPVTGLTDIRGTAFIAADQATCRFPSAICASFEEVSSDRHKYAEANMLQYEEHDPVRGKAVLQHCTDRVLIVNPPQMPLSTKEFDRISALPYTREVHPGYAESGGVPAIEEVRFSVIHNRGCFGACNFCSLAFHQGRMVTVRSHESVLGEVESFVKHPEFKGYVHDVGGPTANFRCPSCKGQLKTGLCRGRNCLTPTPCKSLEADHTDYLRLLRKISAIPGVKKVFVRSGIRFDYLMEDHNGEFFTDLVKNHISGQLKVAPEHCVDEVLDFMGKPHHDVYQKFEEKYNRLNERYGKKQFLVPYLISSHPGSTLSDAVRLAEYLNKRGVQPEQVQDFYPTPGTLSTCMYYTGLDPRTMKQIYVPKSAREKAMQRALLQWKRPEKRQLVLEALRETNREDLIGYGRHYLIPPGRPHGGSGNKKTAGGMQNKSTSVKPAIKPASKTKAVQKTVTNKRTQYKKG